MDPNARAQWLKKREALIKRPQPLVDLDDETREMVAKAERAERANRVDPVDVMIAESLMYFHWEFTKAFLDDCVDEAFFVRMVKGGRKVRQRENLRLINAVLVAGGMASGGGRKASNAVNKTFQGFSREAK